MTQKSQSKSPSLDQRLQKLDLKGTEGQSFADRCSEEGLLITNNRRGLRSPGIDSKPKSADHDVLLNIGMNEIIDNGMTKTKQNQLSNVLSENQLVTDLRQQMPLDNVMGNKSIALETTNQNVQTRTKSSEMPSLLDVDDAAQTMMSSKPESGELPSLPAEFGESPGSRVTEELVFDTNVRLVVRRVWHPSSLVLAFYVTSLAGKMEEVKLTLDVPSNMKVRSKRSNLHLFTFQSYQLTYICCGRTIT